MQIIKKISPTIEEYFTNKEYKFIPGETRIPLQTPTYSHEEVIEALESLLSTWVTMGKKVSEFERLFSSYMGVKYGSMVNSGSSANLVSLSAVSNPNFDNKIKPGDEIITPALTWSTTVFPISNIHAIPVLVDVEQSSFNIDPHEISKAISKKTKGIMPVHLLGNPCKMDQIMEIANDHDLVVIEDTCESYGGKFKGKRVGSFGDISTASFFFSHHISTIEGGMVLTNNDSLDDIIRSIRGFGWIREMKNTEDIVNKNQTIDPKFLFANIGYNLRPTDIQGAFGIHQMKRLDSFIKRRIENANTLKEKIRECSTYLTTISDDPLSECVWFGFPILVKGGAPFSAQELKSTLEKNNIETRAIMAGNIAKQPAMEYINHRVSGKLTNANKISDNAFFIGIHQGIGEEELDFIADTICSFYRGKSR